ncbi:MAG: NUDIX domain-containing protein [bacterium]
MQLPANTIIGSGPVIIENGRVLLNREEKKYGSELFMFPGGVIKNFNETLENCAKREFLEEMGADMKIIGQLPTLLVKRVGFENALAILVHYLAKRIGKIRPGNEIIEWGWYDIDNLPDNCAENVYQIVDEIKSKKYDI